MIKHLFAVLFLFVVIQSKADISVNNDVVSNSSFKASDINTKFQTIKTSLEQKILSITGSNFDQFNSGEVISKQKILNQLIKLPNNVQLLNIPLLGTQISSSELNNWFSFINEQIEGIAGSQKTMLWNKSAGLEVYGTDTGGLSAIGSSWNNGAIGQLTIGDFKLTYVFETLGQASGVGDCMFGYSKLVAANTIGLSTAGASTSMTFYASEGGRYIQHYGPAWVDSPFEGPTAFSMLTPMTLTITRVGGLITYTFVGDDQNRSGTIESNYTGRIYPFVDLYSSSRVISATLETTLNPFWTSSSGLLNPGDLGAISKTSTTQAWSHRAYSIDFVNDNEDFTLTYNVSEDINNASEVEAMFGFSSSLPPAGATLLTHGFYPRSGGVNVRFNNTTTTYPSAARNPSAYVMEIKRVSNSVTFKVDGVLIHTENYSGKVYPHAALYNTKATLISTSIIK